MLEGHEHNQFNIHHSINDHAFNSGDVSSSIDEIVAANLSQRARAETLEDEIVTMAARLNAANYHMLRMLSEFDEIGGWQGDGIKSFAHWLNWKIGMGYMMAREKVRVARALPDLPMIDEAFSIGAISYSKVRAMTRVATPENEPFLLQIAEHGTAAHMEQTVKKFALCKRLENPDPDDGWKREASVSWFQDDDGMVVINARLSPEEGALVLKALEIEVEEIKRIERSHRDLGLGSGNPDGHNTSKSSGGGNTGAVGNEQNDENLELKVDSKNVSAETFVGDANLKEDIMNVRASALTHIAEAYLMGMGKGREAWKEKVKSGSEASSHSINHTRSLGDNYQVFLHINANAASEEHLLSGGPTCHAEQKQFIAPAVARRLACDASVTTVLEDNHGNILNIGRKSRTIPRAIKHALRIRDNGCRFPGCHQQHYTDAHHIKHWMSGGETSLDNLVTLCRFHHTQLHKGEYTVHVHHLKGEHKQRKAPPNIIFRNKHNQVIEAALFPQFPAQPEPPEQVALEIADQLVSDPINKHTAECKWSGEVMDYQMAMDQLCRLEDRGRSEGAE